MAASETRLTPRAVDAVIFDLGGVVASNGRPSDLLRRFPDDPPELVRAVIMGDYGADTDHPWHRLERGEISFADYRSSLAELVISAGLRPVVDADPPPSGSRLMFGFLPNPPVVELVRDLKEAGIGRGLLTNNIREFSDQWRSMLDFDELFDDIVDSHEVGMRKPNPDIYLLSASRLGVDPSRVAFLDDTESNVEAARNLGMHGVLVDEDPSAAVSRVRRLVDLANRPTTE